MKITFYSCYMNHHQLPIAMKFYELLGENYHFVATYPFNEKRRALGYEDMNNKYPFIIRPYENEKEYKRALEMAAISDAIVHDGLFPEYEAIAIEHDTIVMCYSEHLYKNNIYDLIRPGVILKAIYEHTLNYKKNQKSKQYLLCASAYRAIEAHFFNEYRSKIYRWGYFTEVYNYTEEKLFEKKEEDKIQILWVGRFLGWKHPELAVFVCNYLIKKKINFQITLIGEGEERERIVQAITEKKIERYFNLLDSQNYLKIREYMMKSNIYLMLSDHNEGWGAVVNEAMNSGCAVIANAYVGSVPYLIKNGKNGFIYKNKRQLCKYVHLLCKDKKLRQEIGIEAYNTMMQTWSPQQATNNFIALINAIKKNKKNPNMIGPCSKD